MFKVTICDLKFFGRHGEPFSCLQLSRLYSVDMKTLTATKARQNLGNWLQRAAHGEDIGIIHSATGQIIALRPVEVYSRDYVTEKIEQTKPACFKYLDEIDTPAEALKDGKAFIRKKLLKKNAGHR